MSEIKGGPWTTHGHNIKGVTVDGYGRPNRRARCGGPGMCLTCSKEAVELQRKSTASSYATESTVENVRGLVYAEMLSRARTLAVHALARGKWEEPISKDFLFENAELGTDRVMNNLRTAFEDDGKDVRHLAMKICTVQHRKLSRAVTVEDDGAYCDDCLRSARDIMDWMFELQDE